MNRNFNRERLLTTAVFSLFLAILIPSLTAGPVYPNDFNEHSDIDVRRTFDENPLGIAFGGVYDGRLFLDIIHELGINSSHINIRWQEIESQKGAYNWVPVDNYVKQLKGKDRALIRVKSTSKWASPRQGSLPIDLDHYSKFIMNLVARTNGKVRYFENDWEVDNKKFWDDTPQNYVKLLKVFYEAVKKVNPDAIVIVGGHSGHFVSDQPANLEIIDYIMQHGSKYYDMFDVHLYHDLYSIPYRVHWFQKRMEEVGVVKPIVVTEYGGPTPLEYPDKKLTSKLKRKIQDDYQLFEKGLVGYPPELKMFASNIPVDLETRRDEIQASQIVQRTILTLSSGVKMVWYWNLVSGGKHPVFGKLGLIDKIGKKKYAFNAYKRMVRIVGDIEIVEKLTLNNPDIFAFKVKRRDDKNIVYILWKRGELPYGETNTPVSHHFSIPWEKVKVTNILGGEEIQQAISGKLLLTVTDMPIFLEKG